MTVRKDHSVQNRHYGKLFILMLVIVFAFEMIPAFPFDSGTRIFVSGGLETLFIVLVGILIFSLLLDGAKGNR